MASHTNVSFSFFFLKKPTEFKRIDKWYYCNILNEQKQYNSNNSIGISNEKKTVFMAIQRIQ